MLHPLNLHLSYYFTYVSSYRDNLSFSFIYLVMQTQWPWNVHGLQLSLWLKLFWSFAVVLIVFPRYWINMTITLEMYKWMAINILAFRWELALHAYSIASAVHSSILSFIKRNYFLNSSSFQAFSRYWEINAI